MKKLLLLFAIISLSSCSKNEFVQEELLSVENSILYEKIVGDELKEKVYYAWEQEILTKASTASLEEFDFNNTEKVSNKNTNDAAYTVYSKKTRIPFLLFGKKRGNI